MPLLKSVKIQRYRANLLQWGGVLDNVVYSLPVIMKLENLGYTVRADSASYQKMPYLILVPVQYAPL